MTRPETHARKTDPLSSHQAAADNAQSWREDQIHTVAKMVALLPGATSRELSQYFNADRHMVARRLPDAEAKGLVSRGSQRCCQHTHKLALTWQPQVQG